MAWQVRLRRNGKWLDGKTHPQKKDALEDAIQKWKAQAFEGYQLKEAK